LKIKKRYHLKKKKLKEVKTKIGPYNSLIPPKAKVEIIETDLPELILINDEPLIMIINNEPIPTLKGALKMKIESKYVVVDMGAVKFMTKGADVMSPGITEADPNIKEGELVVVMDETHHKPLAIGQSLISGKEMVNSHQGKAVKTLHHVGDKIWNMKI